MDEQRKALDLDELFGQARAVKVRWQGQEYELVRMEGFGPQEIVKFQGLHARSIKMQNNPELDDGQAKELEAVLNEMLGMLCKNLPLEELAFMLKVRILTFYIEETQGKNALETALKKATGEQPSAA
jgi:hypothetical protein